MTTSFQFSVLSYQFSNFSTLSTSIQDCLKTINYKLETASEGGRSC